MSRWSCKSCSRAAEKQVYILSKLHMNIHQLYFALCRLYISSNKWFMVQEKNSPLNSQWKKTRPWSMSWKSYQNRWLMRWHYCNKVLPSRIRTTILMHLHQTQGHWKALLLPGAPKLHEQYGIHAPVMTGKHTKHKVLDFDQNGCIIFGDCASWILTWSHWCMCIVDMRYVFALCIQHYLQLACQTFFSKLSLNAPWIVGTHTHTSCT